MKQMLNALNISDYISKCTTNYIYNTCIYLQNSLHVGFFVAEHSTR